MINRKLFTVNYTTIIYLFILFGLCAQKSPHAGIRVNPVIRNKAMNDESATDGQKESINQSRNIALSQKRVISLGKLSSSGNKPTNGNMGSHDTSNSFGAPNTDSWIPSRNPQDYSKVDVRVMGQSVTPGAVNHLQPDTSPENVRKLRKILAGNLDKEWTSDVRPRIVRQRGVSGGPGGNKFDNDLLSASRDLNITFRDHTGSAYVMPDIQVEFFRKWLVDKATCEMEFIWEDLGPLFWPRWIRRGVCLNKPEKSCSWPPGMKCRPSGSRALQLLHWKCEDSAQVQSRKRAVSSYQRNQIRLPRSIPLNYGPSVQSDAAPKVMRRRNTFWNSRLQSPWSRMSGDVKEYRRLRRRGRGRQTELTPEMRQERRRRRALRLIKQLSKNENGHHCYWQVQKYLISDSCTCSCA